MIQPADFDVHLATCADCAGELARYRELLTAARSLRDALETPPAGLPERVLAHVMAPEVRWRSSLARLARDRRAHVAAASLGGAILGAGAMAILWSRNARRQWAATGGGAAV